MSIFDAVEGQPQVDKSTRDAREAELRMALLEAQYAVLEAKSFPIIVVVGGVDGAGRGETVNLLKEWMDPRHLRANAVGQATDEERERPPMFRFWRKLPPKGEIGVFFGSWYTDPIVGRVMSGLSDAEYDLQLEQARRFETMLAREGALIVKLWFHLSKKAQKRRLRSLEADKETRWRVTKQDWKRYKRYDNFRRTSERAIVQTSTPDAPWTLVDGSDERGRALIAGEALLTAMRARLRREQRRAGSTLMTAEVDPESEEVHEEAPPPISPVVHLLERVDLTKTLEPERYEDELDRLQRRLALLTRKKAFAKISPVLVFEGADAAGKGGAIRRVTQALDARIYTVIPVAAPNDEERVHPYLWRFWRHLPGDGRFAVFDRSWYGRVLVERVEGFASEPEWRRAYPEIVDFEDQLVRAGCPIAKFWLQISPEEQLRRFEERQATPWKNFKITEDDWRNRDKWDAYQRAAAEMIERTSTELSPWTVVEAEDKRWARIRILRQVCETIERAL